MEHDDYHELDDHHHPARIELGLGLGLDAAAEEQLFVELERAALTGQEAAQIGPLFIGVLVLLAQASPGSAPGDVYFGRLNMSALRIRYETMQLKKRYETHQLLPEQAEHLLVLTDDAYMDWARRYPGDTWLPSTAFALAQLYGEMPGATARDRAAALLKYVAQRFPKSPYAQKSRALLHRGVTAKPYPAWARATPTPAPSLAPPSLAPSPSATGLPSAVPSP